MSCKTDPADCREVTEEEGKAIVASAKRTMEEYAAAGTTYHLQVPGAPANTSDCSRFCTTAVRGAGLDYGHLSTRDLAGSDRLKEVSASEARAGDLIWQPGHMGIYTGETGTRKGKLTYQAYDMGGRGPAKPIGQWGPGGWFAGGDKTKFYRVLVDK